MSEGPVLELYRKRLSLGEIEADPAQAAVARRLDDLARALSAWQPPQSRRGLLKRFGGRGSEAPRGLYVHGAVGRGKTMMMDLFAEAVTFAPRRRVHFHEFMAEVHDRIGRARASVVGDPLPIVARELAEESRLLCLDELTVTDIADAMILGRLFSGLLEASTVVVATSNMPPSRLYWNGLNRQLFLPFIERLEACLDVAELTANKDYRLDKLSGRQLYFSPADEHARASLDDHWGRLTGHHPAAAETLTVKGRTIHVPQASMGVARFSFADLCEAPLGALDYLHIAHDFHTVLVDGIPVMGPERRNEARRLITLIDTFYDLGTCLVCSAEAEPDRLCTTGDAATLFERTASRLMEMRSEAWLTRGKGERDEKTAGIT